MREKLKKWLKTALWGTKKPKQIEITAKDVLSYSPLCVAMLAAFYFMEARVDWYLPPLNANIILFFFMVPFAFISIHYRFPRKYNRKLYLSLIAYTLSVLLPWFVSYSCFSQGVYPEGLLSFEFWYTNPYSVALFLLLLFLPLLAEKEDIDGKVGRMKIIYSKVNYVFFYVMIVACAVAGVIGSVNVYFDNASAQVFNIEVKRKVPYKAGDIRHFGTSYTIEIVPPDQTQERWLWDNYDVYVSRELYHEVREGDGLCVYKHSGALGAQWFNVGYCI